jgi:hypothetical protein
MHRVEPVDGGTSKTATALAADNGHLELAERIYWTFRRDERNRATHLAAKMRGDGMRHERIAAKPTVAVPKAMDKNEAPILGQLPCDDSK